jgi:uncharacterized protein (TIRG00374 family)
MYEVISDINPLYFFLSFFAIVPLITMANIEWQMLLKKQKIFISSWYSLKNFFIGYFYGFISPGAVGGFTKAIYLHEESKVPLPKCFSNIIIFNVIDYIALLLFGAIGALFLSSRFPYLFIIISSFIVCLFILLLFVFKKKLSKVFFMKIIKNRIFANIKDRIENSIDTFYEDLPTFKDTLLPFILSFIGWGVKYFELYLIAQLFSINIPFWDFILILAVTDCIASIPISIYGLGTREATLITMFSMFNISREQIVSLSLFWFILIWLTPSVIGIFVTMHETKKITKFNLNGKTAKSFEFYMNKYFYLYQNLAIIVKKFLPEDNKKPTIIDLGTGVGLLLKAIKESIPNSNVIGIDPSESMINLAKENVKAKIIFGSAEKIPINSESVDLVVTRFTLTYWKNPKKSFKEINRILKKKGKFIIEGLNKDFSKWRLFLIKVHMILNKSGLEIARYHADAYKKAYSLNIIKKFLTENSFEIIFKEYNKREWKYIIVAEKK